MSDLQFVKNMKVDIEQNEANMILPRRLCGMWYLYGYSLSTCRRILIKYAPTHSQKWSSALGSGSRSFGEGSHLRFMYLKKKKNRIVS